MLFGPIESITCGETRLLLTRDMRSHMIDNNGHEVRLTVQTGINGRNGRRRP